MSRRWMGWVAGLAVLVSLVAAAPARGGYPRAADLGDAKAIAEKMLGQANKLQTEIEKKWPGDREFIDRARRFANRCQHLVNIMNEALRKDENGRHTQSAYGEVRDTWSRLNALGAADGIRKWKERDQIEKSLGQLADYYR